MNLLCVPFCGRFDYVVLIYPTFAHNKNLDRFTERDPRLYVIIREQHKGNVSWKWWACIYKAPRRWSSFMTAPPLKTWKGAPASSWILAFLPAIRTPACGWWPSSSPAVAKPIRENELAILLFYIPSAKTTKAIFEEYAGEPSQDGLKQLIARLKERKFSHLVFFLRHLYMIGFSN